jgi:UV DNA damage repair endonuclease
MREAEVRLIRDTFSSVMPYLAYPQELRELLEKLLEEETEVGEFVEKLKHEISTEPDLTRKTDGQIFINEFRRRFSGEPSN